jgi:type I restriction enzyme S subunit
MKPYEAYKDSGVEWIGEVPSHWEVLPLKYLVKCNQKVLSENTEPTTKINYIEIGDVSAEKGITATTQYEFGEAPSRARRIVKACDVIVSTVRTYLRAISSIKKEHNDYVASTGFAVLTPQNIYSDFLGYLVLNDGWIGEVISLSKGVSYPSINTSDLVGIPAVNPPLSEQEQIAAYLDRKTAQLDSLIAQKRQLIALLEEERTALINQAVTKGLDPTAPLKPSGIDWLGDVPAHWEVKKLKFILKEKKDSLKTGPFGSHIKNSDIIESGNYRVYTQRNVLDNDFKEGNEYISNEKFEELKGFKIETGDILITTRGTIGRCAVFPDSQLTGILHPCLIRIQPNFSKVIPEWIVWYINDSSLFSSNVKHNSNSTGA